MHNLKTIQHQFLLCLLNQETKFTDWVVKTHKPSTKTRINIYAEGYKLRLIEALKANFPLLQQYIGANQFLKLADEYADNYPSTTNSIRYFGHQLAVFLKTHHPTQPILEELASLEWAVGEAHDAKNVAVITLDKFRQLTEVSWAAMRLTLHPSVKLLKFNYNTHRVWHYLCNDKKIHAQHLKLPQNVLIWRQNFVTHYRKINQPEAIAINSLLKGQKIADVCEEIAKHNKNPSAIIARLLMNWLNEGLIIQVN